MFLFVDTNKGDLVPIRGIIEIELVGMDCRTKVNKFF